MGTKSQYQDFLNLEAGSDPKKYLHTLGPSNNQDSLTLILYLEKHFPVVSLLTLHFLMVFMTFNFKQRDTIEEHR